MIEAMRGGALHGFLGGVEEPSLQLRFSALK